MTTERITCTNVYICALFGEGCLCPENPNRPAMSGPVSEEDHTSRPMSDYGGAGGGGG